MTSSMLKSLKISELSCYVSLTAIISLSVGYSISQIMPDYYYTLRMLIIENFTRKNKDPNVTLDMSGIEYGCMVLPVDIDR
jgi:hypothetical protein